MNSLSSITSAMYNAVRPKTSAETLEKQLISLMTRMGTTCNCGGEEVVAVCKATVDMGVRSIMTGKETAANRILNDIFTMEKIQELSAKGKLDPALAKDIQKFLKAVNTFVPVTLLNKEVYDILEQAQQPGWLTPENTLQPPPAFTLHIFETLNRFLKLPEYTLLHNTNLIPKEKVDVEAKIKPKASDPEGNVKTEAPSTHDTSVKNMLSKMLLPTESSFKTTHLQKATADTTQHARPTDTQTPTVLQTENNPINTGPRAPQSLALQNHTERQDTLTWLQSQRETHTEKTIHTGEKVIRLISEKAPEALAVVRQSIEHLSQMPPKMAEAKMNTLANVIAHVGKADSTQLHPTLTTLHSLIHLPAETLTTVGHSLALVAKQQPEHLPVIRALLESVPQTAKTLTAVAQIILAGIEATPHAQQEGPTPRTLPSLAAVAMTVSKIAPENLSPVATTLINVAQTHPEVVPQLTQALNVIATKSPETLKIIPQLIQTVATQPDSLPQLATTLLALGNTATPQQITQSIHQIATTALETPHTAPLLLEALHTAINTASTQHTVSPMLQQTETRNAVFRATPTPHTASDIQTKGITISQQPAQTPLSQLRAQKALNLTLQLINNTVTTAPETLPMLLTIFKSSASQPLISTKILTVLQDIQQQHPKDMPKVVKALSNFAQSAPQHISKAITLMSSVLTRSPQTLAPLATALQIISTGPIPLQKEALKHLDMARSKNMQTLHHSCSEMAKLEIPPSPRSESSGAVSPQSGTSTSGSVISESASLLTSLQNTQSSHFHLETTALSPNKETEIQQKSPTPTPANNDHPSEPTSRESVAKAPEPTLRKTTINAPQTTHKAEVPSQPVRETAPQPTQQTRPQTNVTPMQTLALFGQISAQAPRDLASTRMTVATITTKAPAALGQTFAAISAVGTHAPQHLAAVVTLLSAIADKVPTALTQVATALSDIATHAPQHLDKAIALLTAIANKAPSALAQVASALSGIATQSPQHVDRAIALLSAIADKAPAALAQVATTLTTVATLSPQRLGATLTLLSTIAEKTPTALTQIANSLNTLAKKSPELFTMVLEIGHKIADKAPELLPKLAQFLTQFHDTLHTDKLHTQLMALMQALAAEASEESTHLLQKLLNLGELKAAEDPALHAYVSSEIKKTRDKAKKAQANNVAKQSSTDQLIHMFDRMEMENWKLAAMFRKSLQGAQLR